MNKEDYNKQVLQDREIRKEFREQNHSCPFCLEANLVPLGGLNTCWIECSCGMYSPLSASYEEALNNLEDWQEIDSELNDRMYPKIGCPEEH